jgi:hypothetical protein
VKEQEQESKKEPTLSLCKERGGKSSKIYYDYKVNAGGFFNDL